MYSPEFYVWIGMVVSAGLILYALILIKYSENMKARRKEQVPAFYKTLNLKQKKAFIKLCNEAINEPTAAKYCLIADSEVNKNE